MKTTALLFLTCLFVAPRLLTAQAKDIPNSKDHPLVSRFAGSVIKFYDVKNFDAYALRLGPVERGKEATAKKQDLEGAITRIIRRGRTDAKARHRGQPPDSQGCIVPLSNRQQ